MLVHQRCLPNDLNTSDSETGDCRNSGNELAGPEANPCRGDGTAASGLMYCEGCAAHYLVCQRCGARITSEDPPAFVLQVR